jgi:hypothetical protein
MKLIDTRVSHNLDETQLGIVGEMSPNENPCSIATLGKYMTE